MTLPVPTMVMNAPRALPRSSSGKAESAIAMPVPWVMLAPTPWTTLNRMRMRMLSDMLASKPPMANMTKPPI